MSILPLPPSPQFSLSGKRALVTGASSGIGLGCAVALARAGATLTATARREGQLNALASALAEEGNPIEVFQQDMSDIAGLEKFILNQPHYDIVVNSAGMARHGPALETQLDDFRAVLQLNLEAAYFLSVFTAKKAIAAQSPCSIIHISSQMGKVGGIDRAVYCASKHALEGMIKAMAIEWGKSNIRINAVCPTFVKTALTQAVFEDKTRYDWVMDHIKLDRVANVTDIAGAVQYLASDAAAMVTGTSLLVDGGWTAE